MIEMKFEDLNYNHIEAAAKIAVHEYFEERQAVEILPDGDYFDLFSKMISELVEHKLGVVAIQNGQVAGFLTCLRPWEKHFGNTPGTFSPVHAHGAVKQDRRRIYSLLYQKAAEKWVMQGILSHAIAVYAHNTDAVDSFFWNGFGIRLIDAIRPVQPINANSISNVVYSELPTEEIGAVVPLKNKLIEHLRKTPAFIPLFFSMDSHKIEEENKRRNSRYFVARVNGDLAAFLEIMASGENFACDAPDMANICGAYMFPQYRGTGIYSGLLAYVMETLGNEGYSRCGVDFESFNPTASGFWTKYFTPYTYGLTRRVDERILRVDNY